MNIKERLDQDIRKEYCICLLIAMVFSCVSLIIFVFLPLKAALAAFVLVIFGICLATKRFTKMVVDNTMRLREELQRQTATKKEDDPYDH